MAHGSSQARGQIGATAANLCHSHSNARSQIPATSATYATACGNARSSTHWARPRIKPESLWRLVMSLTRWATMWTPIIGWLLTYVYTHETIITIKWWIYSSSQKFFVFLSNSSLLPLTQDTTDLLFVTLDYCHFLGIYANGVPFVVQQKQIWLVSLRMQALLWAVV